MASEQLSKRDQSKEEKEPTTVVLKIKHQYESQAAKEAAESQTAKQNKATAQEDTRGLGSITGYAAQKGTEAKDTAIGGVKAPAEYAAEKAQQGYSATKESVVGAGKSALDCTKQTAEKAKDVVVSAGERAVHYAGEKMVLAKDAAVETGWRAAEFSLRKAAEANEATANVGRKVAGYAGEKAEEAKEAREQDSTRSPQHKKEIREGNNEKWEDAPSDLKQSFAMETMPTEDRNVMKAQQESNKQGGLLGAVGETLVEIMQNTEDMVIGGIQESEKKE
ncbi:hypothetical protein Scep_028042 [Stephania cephalantha]|uniref:Seed biotin-containing protein SBP65-like n=1 Tax=Stephania cephalantha TaxID=152367 RepID=A0AAP0E925_9MAGN